MSETPERIGRYRILRRLGQGGVGEVFLAVRDGSSSLVALKRLLPQMHAHPTALARLKREAHLVSMIDHPNVARVLDAGLEEGSFCIATEFVPGKDLEAIRRRVEIPIDLAVSATLSMLEALTAVHELQDAEGNRLNLVHRDLAPKNVMVGFGGAVKLIDFGIAHGRVDDVRTAAGTIIGTPTHLAPEQAAGDAVDQRSDLYTVAVVLHELLVGKRLVVGASTIEIISKILTEPAPHPAELAAHVPRALGDVVLKGLQKAPEKRFATARDFQRALTEIDFGHRWSSEEIASLMRVRFPDQHEEWRRLESEVAAFGEPELEPTRTASSGVAPLPRPPRRRSIAPVALTIGAATAAVLAVWLASRGPEAAVEPAPPPPAALEAPQPTIQPRPAAAELPVPPAEAAPRRVAPPPPPRAAVRRPPPAAAPPPPPPADELELLFRRTISSVDRGGTLDLDLAEDLLAKMKARSDSRSQSNAISHAENCVLTTCVSNSDKIRALEQAMEMLRAPHPGSR